MPFEMSGGVLKIAIADASKLGLMKNLKTITKMEPELYAATISDINDLGVRMVQLFENKDLFYKYSKNATNFMLENWNYNYYYYDGCNVHFI